MSTKKAVEDRDPGEVGTFDPQLSKEANKKTAPEEKEKEVKDEAKDHVESNPMLATLTGRNEVKSGRADHKTSKVASHDTKKDKVSKPLVEESQVHENAEKPDPEVRTEQEALKDPASDVIPDHGTLPKGEDLKISAKDVKDKPLKASKDESKPEVKAHTGHVKEVKGEKDE